MGVLKSRCLMKDRYAAAAMGLIVHQFTSRGIASRFQCLGFSLGAHVCGFAGQWLKKNLNKTWNRIVALDPAGPFYAEDNMLTPNRYLDLACLSPVHAEVVEVLHTDGIRRDDERINFGTLLAMGTSDYYVGDDDHFGGFQPACWTEKNIACSHSMAWKYYQKMLEVNDNMICLNGTCLKNVAKPNKFICTNVTGNDLFFKILYNYA